MWKTAKATVPSFDLLPGMSAIGLHCLLHYLYQNVKKKLVTIAGGIHVRSMYVATTSLHRLIHRHGCFTYICKTFETKPRNSKVTVLKERKKIQYIEATAELCPSLAQGFIATTTRDCSIPGSSITMWKWQLKLKGPVTADTKETHYRMKRG